MAGTTTPGDVVDAVRAARASVESVLDAGAVNGSLTEWAEAVSELQGLVNVATAAQDAAIVRLAAIESEWAEDGTVVDASGE